MHARWRAFGTTQCVIRETVRSPSCERPVPQALSPTAPRGDAPRRYRFITGMAAGPVARFTPARPPGACRIRVSAPADRGRSSSDETRLIPPLAACLYRNMTAAMARAATTSDVFNAIAEPQRREILVLLRAGGRPVTELAQELRMTQPGASKHLRVLREVGLVRDRKAGKQRLYGLNARGLRPVDRKSVV